MNLKIALLQISSIGTDLKKNQEKGDYFCRRAKESGADIILFPEIWSIGYENFDDTAFDQNFDPDNVSKELSEKIKVWSSYAVDLNSEFTDHFRKLSRELDTAIAITFLQRNKEKTGKPFNSVAIFDRHGNCVLNYSKVHTCDFYMEHFCESGNEFSVCELDTLKGIVNVGAMICFDREFPESARELMLQGAEIILVPNCCEMDSHRAAQLKTRAFENMVGVALANYPAPKCNGHSQAYSPIAYSEEGKESDNLILIAGKEEGIFFPEFDMEAIRNYRGREVWGNAFRKVSSYSLTTSREIKYPFKRISQKK